MTDEFKNLLAFLILMGGRNILSKSPDYIMEKFETYVNDNAWTTRNDNRWEWGLDQTNQALMQEYIERWQ